MRHLLTIWTNVPLPPEANVLLTDGTRGHRLIRDADACRTAEVAFGQPDPRDVIESTSLRWVAVSSAGYTRYDTSEVRNAVNMRNGRMTNASGVFAEPCAQHALALMLADARGLPTAAELQREERWDNAAVREPSMILRPDKTVALFGYGAIARRLAALLEPFGPKIVGVRRSPRGDERCTMVSSQDEAAVRKLLGDSDIVVNALPAGPSSDGYFNADRFDSCKRGCIYISIGRGSTTVSADLRGALVDGPLRSAWLDVTAPEPLPPGDPLWTTPHCHITPHTAGGMQNEQVVLVRHFLDNLRRFEQGEPLVDQII